MSNRRGERVRIRSKLDEEAVSLDGLHAAERLFPKLAVRMLFRGASEPESAGPRLHRCNGSALTAQESGPALR